MSGSWEEQMGFVDRTVGRVDGGLGSSLFMGDRRRRRRAGAVRRSREGVRLWGRAGAPFARGRVWARMQRGGPRDGKAGAASGHS